MTESDTCIQYKSGTEGSGTSAPGRGSGTSDPGRGQAHPILEGVRHFPPEGVRHLLPREGSGTFVPKKGEEVNKISVEKKLILYIVVVGYISY